MQAGRQRSGTIKSNLLNMPRSDYINVNNVNVNLISLHCVSVYTGLWDDSLHKDLPG